MSTEEGDEHPPPGSDADNAQLTTDEVCRVIGVRVRELRLAMGHSLERLASITGLSMGMLSKIENGQTSPSLGTMTRLVNALGVPLSALFRGLDEERDAVIVPDGGGLEIAHEGDVQGRTYHDLGSLRGPSRQIEPVLVTITDPDAIFPRFQHAGVEFIHMLEGVVEYGYGTKHYVLRRGDTMQLHGEVPHGPLRLLDVPIRFLSLKVHAGAAQTPPTQSEADR